MKSCPKCRVGALERRYRIEVVDAIRGVWKLRLTCSNPGCGATGLRDPYSRRWLFFDDIITGGLNGSVRLPPARRP